jgi:O-antigen/teichoic acid export membrane protein
MEFRPKCEHADAALGRRCVSQTGDRKMPDVWEHRRGWLMSIADQGLVSASSFFALVVITRSIPPAEVGRYALTYATVMIMSSLNAALISTPHAVLSIGRDAHRFLSNQFLALAGLSVLQLAVFVPFLLFGLGFDPSLVLPGMCFLVLLQCHELTRTAFFAQLRPQTTLLLDACTHLPRMLVLALAAWSGTLTLAGALWIIAASLLVWPIFSRPHRLRPAAIAQHVARSWQFGRWLLIESLAYVVSTQAYLYVVNALLNLESVAGLAATQNLLNAVNVVFMGVVAYLLPLSRTTLLEHGFEDWRQLLRRTALLVTLALIVIVGAIALFAGELLTLFYGADYAQFAPLLLGLSLPLTLQGANAIAAAAFQTAERPQIGLAAKVAGGTFALLWAFPGIAAFGVWGAVIGLGATPVIWIITYAIFLKRGALSKAQVMPRVTARLSI